MDLLSELVERSLVTGVGEEEMVRFRMLEPIRQYGRELLEESGESEGLKSRHTEYFLKLAEEADVAEGAAEADPRMMGVPPVEWLRRMETEQANLRAALSWSLTEDTDELDGQRVEQGLRLALALFWFWFTGGSLTEGRSYLERALQERPYRDPLEGPSVQRRRWDSDSSRGFEGAKALIEEGLALYRQLGDEESIASALTDLGMAALWGQRDDIPVMAVMEELGELRPRVKNRRTLAYLLLLEGMIALSRGDLERSVALHERSLEFFRELRDAAGIMNTVGQLGGILLVRGDYEGAVPPLRECLRLLWKSDWKVSIQFSLYGLACVAASREQPVRAARLWGAVEGMEEAYGVHISPIALAQMEYEGRLAVARSQLDEEVWSAAWAQGKAMALEHAVEYALSEEREDHEPPALVTVPETQPHPAVDEPAERFTPREQEIALLVARGLTNRQIAQELSISERTVENHIASILRKQGFSSRARIATWVAHR